MSDTPFMDKMKNIDEAISIVQESTSPGFSLEKHLETQEDIRKMGDKSLNFIERTTIIRKMNERGEL